MRLPGRIAWGIRTFGYYKGPRIMSRLRKWWVLARNPHADIRFTEPIYLGPGFTLHIPHRGTFIAGPRCDFRRGFRCELEDEAVVEIGADSVFTNNVLIQCATRISIGEHCMFGQSTLVVDGNHRFRELDRPMLQQGYDYKPLTIADHATVTTKCTIIANLGERCFVGANSVVTRDVPAFTVAAGNPARPLDYFGPEGRAREGSDAVNAGEGAVAPE
jgi:acetyltransferase-like isoleucine patch superfamily enzyme